MCTANKRNYIDKIKSICKLLSHSDNESKLAKLIICL